MLYYSFVNLEGQRLRQAELENKAFGRKVSSLWMWLTPAGTSSKPTLESSFPRGLSEDLMGFFRVLFRNIS